MYSADIVGLFALSQTLLFFISIFTRLGLDTSIIRLINQKDENDHYIRLFLMISVFSIIISLIIYYFSNIIANIFFLKSELKNYIEIFSIFIIPYSLLCLNSEYFRGYKKTFYFSIFRQTTITTIAVFILLFFHFINFDNNFSPLLAYCFSILILFIFSCYYIFKIFYLNNKNIEKKKYIDILKISIPMMLTSSMFYILQWADTLILGIYNTSKDVGIYNIVIKISMFASLGLFAVNSIAAPLFAEYFYSNNNNNFFNSIKQSSKLIFWSSIPILLFIVFFSDKILVFFGEDYLYGKTSLLILMIGQFFSSISGSVGYILQMTGKQKIFQNIILISTVVNIILNFILIPKYGLLGAATSSMISIILWNFISVIYIYRKYNVLTLYIPDCLVKN